MTHDDVSKAERQTVMADDRRATTYHAVAQVSIDDERGGRYGALGRTATVTGSRPIACHPQQPSTSPWRCDPCGPELPLGYAIDAIEPVGELHERGEAVRTE